MLRREHWIQAGSYGYEKFGFSPSPKNRPDRTEQLVYKFLNVFYFF